MVRYFYNFKNPTWLRIEGNPRWIDPILQNTLGDYKEISFWQYYLPRLFPISLIQDQKEVKHASSCNKTNSDPEKERVKIRKRVG